MTSCFKLDKHLQVVWPVGEKDCREGLCRPRWSGRPGPQCGFRGWLVTLGELSRPSRVNPGVGLQSDSLPSLLHHFQLHGRRQFTYILGASIFSSVS